MCHRVSCALLVSDFNQYSTDIYKTIEYQIPLKIISAVQKYLHVCRRTDKVLDGTFSVSALRYLKRISKPRNRDLPGKWCIASVKVRILLAGVWTRGLPENETGVLITQPRRRSLLKLTPLGYAVPSNDLERQWNEAAFFVLLPLTFFCTDWRKTRKTFTEDSRDLKITVSSTTTLWAWWVKVKCNGRSENKFKWPVIW